MKPAVPGTPKLEIDTPALCIDLEVMQQNLESMAQFIAGHNMDWRPHEKCHKTPAIAHRQRAAGAIGVTCAKVSEAEVMVANGIHDVLVANMVVGEPKVRRVAAMCRSADPIIACDHFVQAEQLSSACVRAGVECRMIVEVDIGLNRVGTRPGTETLQLAEAIDGLPGVRLAGIMGYEGHLLTVADRAEKESRIREAMGILIETRDQFVAKGLCCDIVSAGGTGSYQLTCLCEGLTEIQAGGGIFADPLYQEKMGVEGLGYALTILATVVSRPTRDRAIVDAGRKTFNSDLQMPVIKGWPDARPVRFSAEHGELELGGESRDLKIGDKVELVVGYADLTTILHEFLFGFRDDVLEVVWPVLGRGCLQ